MRTHPGYPDRVVRRAEREKTADVMSVMRRRDEERRTATTQTARTDGPSSLHTITRRSAFIASSHRIASRQVWWVLSSCPHKSDPSVSGGAFGEQDFGDHQGRGYHCSIPTLHLAHTQTRLVFLPVAAELPSSSAAPHSSQACSLARPHYSPVAGRQCPDDSRASPSLSSSLPLTLALHSWTCHAVRQRLFSSALPWPTRIPR